ncbi:kinase binding protein CGI-121-domain-containing protein [Mycotypha africana]|uniref:kinase binding protein CGI-121-domain-containing protein n=1 Tax=Mycotypha africana TaxID=64632 RepID=UPI0023006E18|nr:kinase binding protein CGI-121-domain-containing protein [Mycotypha africana]KAI8991477.1 kinase binding protein CGI-121-domain-containing protein [Mycotypha africana]
MESFKLDTQPDKQVHIALFKNVANSPELRHRLSSQDQTLTCCLLNAKMVVNPFHVLLAVNRAISDEIAKGKLKTHNIHSEILYNFGLTNNIGKTFQNFGISDDTADVIAVKVGCEADEAESFMKDCVKGELVPLQELANVTDLQAIEQVYQLGNLNQDPQRIMSLVAGGMALRGF